MVWEVGWVQSGWVSNKCFLCALASQILGIRTEGENVDSAKTVYLMLVCLTDSLSNGQFAYCVMLNMLGRGGVR